MYFNWKALLGLSLIVFVLPACQRWFNEDPPPRPIIEFDKDKTRCLKNWSQILGRYFLAQSHAAEIEDFWICLDSVVWHFQKHVRGQTPGVYSIAELVRFFEELFLDKKIPNSLVERFKDFKRAIFSGDRENFDAEDLIRLHSLLSELKFGSLLLLPHMGHLNFSLETDKGLDSAIRSIGELASRWKRQISSWHQFYKIEHMIEFLRELKDHLDIKVFNLTKDQWGDLINAVKKMKLVFLGAPADEIQKQDWPLVYERLAHIYISALLYHYRIKNKIWYEPESAKAIFKMSKMLFANLRESSLRQPHQGIAVNDIVDLFDTIRQLGWLHLADIRSESLKQALIGFVRSVFARPSKEASPDETYIFAKDWDLLDREIEIWGTIQNQINAIMANKKISSRREFTNALEALANEKLSPHVVSSILEFKQIVEATPYLVSNQESGGMILSQEEKYLDRVEFHALSNLHWISRVVHLIIYGYGSAVSGISEKQFDQFYLDFRNLGIDLGLASPKSKKAGKRMHLEADNFTFVSDGNGLVNWMEATQELQILLSAGMVARRVLKLKRDESFEQLFKLNFGSVFKNLPEMVAEYSQMPEWDKMTFIEMLVGDSGKNLLDLNLRTTEVRYITGLVHFAESVMLRFDLDHSGFLDASEMRQAFDVFYRVLDRATLVDGSGKMSRDDLFVGFIYYVQNGELLLPSDGLWSKVQAAVKFWNIKRNIENNNIQVRRNDVVRALMRFKQLEKRFK